MGVRPLPISKDEFARMLRFCVPPIGWMKRIGVANSGGADSTCLLFLIHRYLSDLRHTLTQNAPQHVVSFTVDHDLQQTSHAMAEHCEKFARSLKVHHITSKIIWGEPPFPNKPTESEFLESTARSARYYSLFKAMREQNVHIIAFGHHADDQVETSLIRLSMGSSAAGAGGMRPCRRWGMGVDRKSEDAYFGYEGMNRWIIRPLLDVDKERIIATCEENNLDYVVDKTNFQPAMTLRNAIRYEIRHNRHGEPPVQYPSQISERLSTLKRNVSAGDLSISLNSSVTELRNAVRILTFNVQDIDRRGAQSIPALAFLTPRVVDSLIRRCRLPTQPGTFLLLHERIGEIQDMEIQRALILRVTRYASHHPWGSPQAEAGRRRESIDRIVYNIWGPVHSDLKFRPFTTGGGVLWTPIFIREGFIRLPERLNVATLRPKDRLGWLASRHPPMNKESLIKWGLTNKLEVDASKPLLEGLRAWRSGGSTTISILYDCRFLVRFDLEIMPRELGARLSELQNAGRIIIFPQSRWYGPMVVLQNSSGTKIIHSTINEDTINMFFPPIEQNIIQEAKQKTYKPIDSGWITVDWIRPLTAI